MSRKAVWVVFTVLIWCGVARAQQTVITGQVLDVQGNAVAGAKVVGVSAAGASYRTVTDKNGSFQFPNIPAADYTLQAEAEGFSPSKEKLTVLVGQMANVTLQLGVAGTVAEVEVTSEEAQIDTTSSQVAGNIDPETFQKIPLNGRNYMDLATMVPGIRRDAITNYAPLGTLNGGREQFNLDGQQVTSNGADTSFGQPQFSRDAISQFQIVTNQFDATQGRTAQLAMNMQSKSGSNSMHGTAFGYFRNDVFDAADPIAKKVLPFSDQQYGGTFGAAAKKDKLWYFASFEAEHRPQVTSTSLIGFRNSPLTYNFSNTLNNKEYLGRLDYQPGVRDHLFFRFFRFDTSSPDLLPSGNSSISRQYTNEVHPYGLIGSWTRNISSNLVNTIFGSWYYTSNLNSPLVPSMQLTFPTQVIGAAYNYPSHLPVSVYQFRDDAFWLKGKHSIKMGFEYLRELNDGSFPQNIRGVATLSADPPNWSTPETWDQAFPNQLDPSTWDYVNMSPYVTAYTQGFGNFNTNIHRNIVGMWIQDDWKVMSRLTVNLGTRYDNDIGLITAGNDTVNGIVAPKHGNNWNFGPRAGFAYDVFGKGKTVIRGGFGIYFAEILANQSIDAQLFNGVQTVQAAVASSQFGPNFNILDPFAGQDTNSFIQNAQNIVQAIQPQAPTIRTPWAGQLSLGVQQEFPQKFTASLDVTGNRMHHDWLRHDDNVAYDPNTGWNQTVITKPASCPNPDGCITGHVQPNPHYSTINQFATPDGVGALLKTVQVSILKQTSFGVSGFASYTYGLEKDNSNGPFTYASNPFNLADEWASSVDDQHHTLAITSNYQAKWGLNGGITYHYGSGLAYAPSIGKSATGLVSSASTTRSFCYGPLHELQSGSICHYVNEASGYTPVVYNQAIHNHFDPATGLTTFDRNSFRGQPIERVDANLAKVLPIHERYKITTQVEAFNLLNHSNYGSYNTVITSSTYGAPTATSGVLALYARQLQFSARLDF